jgi:hypothetical protein
MICCISCTLAQRVQKKDVGQEGRGESFDNSKASDPELQTFPSLDPPLDPVSLGLCHEYFSSGHLALDNDSHPRNFCARIQRSRMIWAKVFAQVRERSVAKSK